MATVKHVKVLGRKANPDALFNAGHLTKFIEDLVVDLGMELLGDVVVRDVELDISKLGREPFEDEGGISVQGAGVKVAFATLSTSHVAIHAWPLREEYHLDVYSCREFEERVVSTLCKKRLGGICQMTDLTFSLAWKNSGPGRPLGSSPTF